MADRHNLNSPALAMVIPVLDEAGVPFRTAVRRGREVIFTRSTDGEISLEFELNTATGDMQALRSGKAPWWNFFGKGPALPSVPLDNMADDFFEKVEKIVRNQI